MGPGIGRRKLCLAVWAGRIASGDNAAGTGGTNRIPAWISRPLFDYQPDSKARTSSWQYREPVTDGFRMVGPIQLRQ